MPGVVESQSTCSPKKGIEVQSEGTRELELGSRRLQRAKKETGMLAIVSLVHGTLTGGSLDFPTQECGDWSPVGGIWVMGVELRTELMLFF